MTLFLSSDLHDENRIKALNVPEKAEVVILAGDLIYPKLAFKQLAKAGRPLIAVAGNHDFYHNDITEGISVLKRLASNFPDVNVLENEVLVFGDTRFIGSTFWSSYGDLHPRLVAEALYYHKDSKHIKSEKWWIDDVNIQFAEAMQQEILAKCRYDHEINQDDGLEPYLTEINRDVFHPIIAYQLHKKAINFVASELAKPFKGKTVVVTHHPPTFEAIRHLYLGSQEVDIHIWNNSRFIKPGFDRVMSLPLEPYMAANYGSPLEHCFIKKGNTVKKFKGGLIAGSGELVGADLWLHGHLHSSFEYHFAGTRFIVNALMVRDDLTEVENTLIHFDDKPKQAFSYPQKRLLTAIEQTITKLQKWLTCSELDSPLTNQLGLLILTELEDIYSRFKMGLCDFEVELSRIQGLKDAINVETLFGMSTRVTEFSTLPVMMGRDNEGYIQSRQHIQAVIEKLEQIKSLIKSGKWTEKL